VPYPGRVTVFRATDRPEWPALRFDDPTLGWGPLALGGVADYPVPGNHFTFLDPPQVSTLAASLKAVLG
jgi:thioesterase domain-containing protein